MEKQIKSFRLVFRRCHAQRLTGHMILYVRLLSASSRPHRQSVMSGQTAHIESNVFFFFTNNRQCIFAWWPQSSRSIGFFYDRKKKKNPAYARLCSCNVFTLQEDSCLFSSRTGPSSANVYIDGDILAAGCVSDARSTALTFLFFLLIFFHEFHGSMIVYPSAQDALHGRVRIIVYYQRRYRFFTWIFFFLSF